MDVIKFIREDEYKTKWVKKCYIHFEFYQLTFFFLSLIFCFLWMCSTMDIIKFIWDEDEYKTKMG